MPADRTAREKPILNVSPAFKRSLPPNHMQRPKTSIRIPPVDGMQLFLSRTRKILEAKSCAYKSLEIEVWNAWRDLSDRARNFWAAEEGYDKEEPEGSRFIDVFKVVLGEEITPMKLYAGYMSLDAATAQSKWDGEDHWAHHYFDLMVLEIRVDTLTSASSYDE